MTSPTPRLLDGLTVLDVSRVFAGPHATMLLADLGATVWKLEPPDGDETRGWGPPFWGDPADRRSAYFAAVNRNKRSIVVNLKTDAGREVLDRLADRADLLMHNYLPSVAERLGLGSDRLQARHPGLVVSVVGGFPGTGPMAERPAYDLVAQAWSGQMAVTGEPGGGPIKIGVGLLDLLAGLEAAVAALAALTGPGTLSGCRRPHIGQLGRGRDRRTHQYPRVLPRHRAGASPLGHRAPGHRPVPGLRHARRPRRGRGGE